LEVNFGTTGKIHAGTPLGNGPGFAFYAPNGHRRDIVAWIGGLYIGVSSSASAPSSVLEICENGVGIGPSNTCPDRVLAISPNANTNPIAKSWDVYSSRQYKTDIQELSPTEYQQALQQVVDTRVVHFRYKGQAEDTKLKLGVIAEESPDVVLAEKDPQAVSLGEYVSLLHAALKAQQAQIEAQQGQIEQLQAVVKQFKK